MKIKKAITAMIVFGFLISIFASAPAPAAAAQKPFVYGLLLVGPFNDHGWEPSSF
jgi:basic membrane lipoprotein Med (substrate-binding protein (PBP1-ABC) superfamily)